MRREDALIPDRISWRVARGEHWVILGTNGSGKTSLLSALTGHFTPSAGSIELLHSTHNSQYTILPPAGQSPRRDQK
jgi:iron complex transport system ATP-binding protein